MDTERKSNENSLFVATYKKWPSWERGILYFNLDSVSYFPIARTWANVIVIALIIIWFSLGAILAATGTGFVGLIPNIIVAYGIFLGSLPFSSSTRKKAIEIEKIVKSNGIHNIKQLDGGLKWSWDNLLNIALKNKTPFTLKLTETSGVTYNYQLLGKASAFDFASGADTIAAVKNVVNNIFPNKLIIE